MFEIVPFLNIWKNVNMTNKSPKLSIYFIKSIQKKRKRNKTFFKKCKMKNLNFFMVLPIAFIGAFFKPTSTIWNQHTTQCFFYWRPITCIHCTCVLANGLWLFDGFSICPQHVHAFNFTVSSTRFYLVLLLAFSCIIIFTYMHSPVRDFTAQI